MFSRIVVYIIITLALSACGQPKGGRYRYYEPSYDGYMIADNTIAKQLPVKIH